MMKRTLALTLATLAAACVEVPEQPQSLAGHPALGTWEIRVNASCIETYTYRTDGTRYYTSGSEVGESRFTIEGPDARGVYAMTDTITKDNGKPDCNGGVVPVGDVANVYLRFSPSGNAMLLCRDPETKRCLMAKRIRDL